MFEISLRAARVSCGYTVGEVAEYCGVSSSTIRKYENNPSRLPLYLIIQLSGLYGIPPNSLSRVFINRKRFINPNNAQMTHKLLNYILET